MYTVWIDGIERISGMKQNGMVQIFHSIGWVFYSVMG
jgi:hypothetical protein